MAKRLNLSVNELWGLLSRSFEAVYGHERDFYDMARMVLWLETHGHDGVVQLVSALPTLEATVARRPTLAELKPGHIVIDAQDQSLLCLAPSIGDLAIAEAASVSGETRIDIINAVDSAPLLSALSVIAAHGLSAVLLTPKVTAMIEKKTALPTLYNEKNSEPSCLICAQLDIILDDYISNAAVTITPDMQERTHAKSLERGVSMTRADYDHLNAIADRILVEATDASRKGAGE